jgi:hypothetical protein
MFTIDRTNVSETGSMTAESLVLIENEGPVTNIANVLRVNDEYGCRVSVKLSKITPGENRSFSLKDNDVSDIREILTTIDALPLPVKKDSE